MRFLTGTLTAVLCGAVALAADAKFSLTGENTKVEFVGAKKDGKHTGGFKALTGTITVTGTDLSTAKIDVTIETASLYSDNEKLTEHLKAPDFFDVKTNPTAKFVTTSVAKGTGADEYTVTGDLTLNGKTKSISFPAKMHADGGELKLKADFKIDRTQFGMTYGKGKIEDDVEIKLHVDAKK